MKINKNSNNSKIQSFSIVFPTIALLFPMGSPKPVRFAELFPIIAYLFPVQIFISKKLK
jgi:hypothetical protein